MKTGKPWSEVGSVLISEFQGGSSNEDKRLSDLESAIVHLYPSLNFETKDITWGCKLQATVHVSSLQDLVTFSLLQGPNIGLQTSRRNAFLSAATSSHTFSMKHSVLTMRSSCSTTGRTIRLSPLVQTTVIWHVKRCSMAAKSMQTCWAVTGRQVAFEIPDLQHHLSTVSFSSFCIVSNLSFQPTLQGALSISEDAADKRHAFVERKIGRFLHQIAEALRMNKKVNLNQRSSTSKIWDIYDQKEAG